MVVNHHQEAMVDTNLLLEFREWILATFNKEAIAIFCLLCVSFFGIASIFAYWGFKTGQFQDSESAKLEMMDC